MITGDLVQLETSQRALTGSFDRERGSALMDALDACNRPLGTRSRCGWQGWLRAPTELVDKVRDALAPYTTRADELPIVSAA